MLAPSPMIPQITPIIRGDRTLSPTAWVLKNFDGEKKEPLMLLKRTERKPSPPSSVAPAAASSNGAVWARSPGVLATSLNIVAFEKPTPHLIHVSVSGCSKAH